MKKEEPLFEKNARKTLKDTIKVFEQRGGSYGDSYKIDQHLALKAILKKFNVEVDDRILNAIQAAVLVDTKYSRLVGGYKEDSIVDMLAYGAFLVEEMKTIEKEESK